MGKEFSITPLTDEIITVNNPERLPFIRADLEKKYNGKVSLVTVTVVLPVLEKEVI